MSQINYLKTGYSQRGLLDVHYVTDLDIEKKDPYAAKSILFMIRHILCD